MKHAEIKNVLESLDIANRYIGKAVCALPQFDLWAERLDDIGRDIQTIVEEMETSLHDETMEEEEM